MKEDEVINKLEFFKVFLALSVICSGVISLLLIKGEYL